MSTVVAEIKAVDGETVYVERSIRFNPPEFFISASEHGVYLTKKQAPALALAILEAAGYSLESDYSMGSAVRELKDHLHAQSVLAEREQLDKEAEAIYEAFAKESIFTRHQWEDLEGAKHPWIAAAKKARELHKGEAK